MTKTRMHKAKSGSYKKFWTALMESREKFDQETKASREDADKRRNAIDRQLAELTNSQKETDKRVGELTNRYGKISEHKVIPTLIDAFKSLGYDFSMTTQNVKVDSFEHDIHCQADAMLENNDCVIVVEVKTTLRSDDVADHIKRMQKFRSLANIQNDTRKYYGAIAGISIGRNEKTHALRKGFFVLEPVEETFVITIPARPGGVKAW
ncbi:hypothetical protein ACYULU_05195 [Breznakiellaceae bacterium SP9]